MSPAQFICDQRPEAASIHQIVGLINLSFGGGDFHAVRLKVHLGHQRILQDGRAIRNGGGRQEVIRILPIKMQFVPVGSFGNDCLQA